MASALHDRVSGGDRLTGVPAHERHFYSATRAFGRFGMRVFDPEVMEAPHWHGHVEANLITGAEMEYDIDGERLTVPEGRFVLFWAGIPHQLTKVVPVGDGPVRLSNLYIPVDAFLFMSHIGRLQVALLGGAMAILPESLVDGRVIGRWYRDYRANDFERLEIMKMELNATLRRALLGEMTYLRPPIADPGTGRVLSSGSIHQVVAMVRFILENLERPLTNSDVAAVIGLHRNYAMSLFSRTMRMPMKQFIIRMRLMRARALLTERNEAISQVAERSGFSSISQFYDHFRRAYGLSPHQMRARYARMDLR